MLFNSFEFLVFFIVVTTLYYITPFRLRWALLLIASCIFYMALMPVYIFILLGIIFIDYTTALFIEPAAGTRRKAFLAISLSLNLAVLFIFKYYNFFAGTVSQTAFAYHIAIYPLPYLNIILPLGLSFHTFQAMSYTIEVYRGREQAEHHLGIYALYVMFYPQLVAGPIERPQNLLPQFHSDIPFSYANLLSGLRLMMWGLFKKVVVADRLSSCANAVFTDPGSYHGLQVAAGVLAFSIQIYCDFSGYTDIALGAARCMGYTLMINFNRPYLATNIREFWARWHISLSTWFRDYVYIPMGGNRVAQWQKHFNIAVVFILSGFWHGANWTFLIWGAIHAFYFFIYSAMQRILSRLSGLVMHAAGWLLTFLAVSLAWIFFRAESVDKARFILSKIFSERSSLAFFDTENFRAFYIGVCLLACAYVLIVEAMTDPRLDWFDDKPRTDAFFCSLTLILILTFGVFGHQTFIYFQF